MLAREKTKALLDPPRSRQARGRLQEAARDVRALLDLLRENETSVPDRVLASLLDEASSGLKILDPELGEEELIESVAAERAKLHW